MARRAKRNTHLDDLRAGMRLLLAAAALFVLLAGLTLLTYLKLSTDTSPTDCTLIFMPFFLTGLLLFAASAFINAPIIKLFTNYLSARRP